MGVRKHTVGSFPTLTRVPTIISEIWWYMGKQTPTTCSGLFVLYTHVKYYLQILQYNIQLKPIFHQNAKYLASGLALGNAPDAGFLRYPTQNIPTCWYILALPPTPIPDANPKICVTPDANPRRQSVEYSWRWVPTQNAGVGHVYFFFFV